MAQTNTALVQININASPEQLTAGVYRDCGDYNPTLTNAYPACGGSGQNGSVLQANIFDVSEDGTINGVVVKKGDVLRAKVDNPGQEHSNWHITKQSTFE